MTAIEHITAAQQTELCDQDGDPVSLTLLPPLASNQIDALAESTGQPLPEELRALLSFCSGIDTSPFEIDFTGASMSYGGEDIFPHALPIAGDGFGNFWVLDLTPATTQTAPVFFACHDAPVILYQSPDIASFLAELFRMNLPPHKSLINDVHDDRLFDVWGKNPGVIEHAVAASSPDPHLREFALSLPEQFQFIDLRHASPGMGFSWGRYGPVTEIRRHGYERIFAYAKPPKKTGMFSKLFGG